MNKLRTVVAVVGLITFPLVAAYTPESVEEALKQEHESLQGIVEHVYTVESVENGLYVLQSVNSDGKSIVLMDGIDPIPTNTAAGHVVTVLWDESEQEVIQILNHGKSF